MTTHRREPQKAGLSGEPEEAGLSGEPQKAGISGEPEEAGISGEPQEAGLSGEPQKAGISGGVNVQAGYHSYTSSMGTHMVQSLWEITQQPLVKLNISYQVTLLSLPALSIQENHIYTSTQRRVWVFTAASHVTDPHWMQSRCSQVEQIS